MVDGKVKTDSEKSVEAGEVRVGRQWYGAAVGSAVAAGVFVAVVVVLMINNYLEHRP